MSVTETQVVKLLTILSATYPHSFKGDTPEIREARIQTWLGGLQEFDYETAQGAIMAHIYSSTDKYAPNIGEIRAEIMTAMRGGDGMTFAEAWAIVRKAIPHGIYGAEEAYAQMPRRVQMALGSADAIRVMAMDENYNEAVYESNFRRAYETVCMREDKAERIPLALSEKMEERRMKLIEGMRMGAAE